MQTDHMDLQIVNAKKVSTLAKLQPTVKLYVVSDASTLNR